ncbi:hypothetical protein [Rhodanobacter lindaniclasticus]
MKLITLGLAAVLAAGSAGIANATPNLVQNGDFSATSGLTAPSGYGYTGQQAGYQGFTVDHWDAHGYTMWYPNPSDAVGGCAYTQYHYPGSGNPGGYCSSLNAVGPLLPDGSRVGPFIGMDGVQNSIQGSISQMLTGLTNGASYTVSFYYGTTQETQASSATQSHDEFLKVGFGGNSQNTSPDITTNWGDFEGWFTGSMTFTADGANQLLSFMAYGMPSDGPPMILLTGVSVTQNVPEPSELSMFGLGLLGLGLLTLFARRRAMRHQA